MSLRICIITIFTVVFFTSAAYPEPVQDQLIGKVNIRNSAKLDIQAKKELTAIAAKIKKIKSKGAVKIIGDIPSAESQEEYLSKAVFMARTVEAQIRKLLSDRYQVFVAAAKYSGEKRSGSNSVEIHLYPHELRVEGTGLISSQIAVEEQPKGGERTKELSTLSSPKPPEDAVSSDSGLTPPIDDDAQVQVTSRKERTKVETEDPALANELVNKAKARAAQKAKRLEQEK